MTKKQEATVLASLDTLGMFLDACDAGLTSGELFAQARNAYAQAREALQPKEGKTKVDKVWPSSAFWQSAFTVWGLTSDQWGAYPRTKPEDWQRGKLVFRATGNKEAVGY